MNNASDTLLACRAVRKTYRDGVRELVVLDGIDLDVPAEKILAVTGPSGVGKSTLLHIMGSLDQPSSGEVLFRGEPIHMMRGPKINRIRNENIGFVFQFYHLLPEFSALENVMMPSLNKGAGKRNCRDRAESLLAKVGLQERTTHKPGQLSGGEQQRVAIARALFNHPEVLLCDEPTGNLDEHTGAEIIGLLCKLNRDEKVTVVVVTHDDAMAQNADHWVYLHQGKAHSRR